jgi:hypothetical protein
MEANSFPPYPVGQVLLAKMPELKNEGFGYQILPFEHEKHSGRDVGLTAFSIPTWYGSESTNFMLAPAVQTTPVAGFARLMGRLNGCYEREVKQMRGGKVLSVSFSVGCVVN